MKILGVDSRGLPSPAGTVDYKCVLVQYDENDPSACCVLGIGTPEWVALHGDVIHEPSNANYWFPQIETQLAASGSGLVYSARSV